MPLVFESSGYVAKLAKRYLTEWASRARRAQGREGEAVLVPARGASCPPRYYWNAAATISYLRDALLSSCW